MWKNLDRLTVLLLATERSLEPCGVATWPGRIYSAGDDDPSWGGSCFKEETNSVPISGDLELELPFLKEINIES